MSKPLPSSSDLTQLPTEAEIEKKLMQDVHLLLVNLMCREEVTVKLILNCLYDAGATNLINQKFQSQSLNKILKLMAKMSKPAFKMIAWQWLKQNCPQLITDWLRSKIEFKRVETPQVEVVVETPNAQLNSISPAQYQIYEVKKLRSQIKFLLSMLVGVVTVLTGSFVWAGYLLERSHSQVIEELRTQVKTLEASVDKH
ncbi:MAG: hypothetical protein EAZ77_14950 [Nostocales cyanobacterium]|nr:MAG: hypothetical protein EAZ77_14950 [Nostocales cyanobacterium]